MLKELNKFIYKKYNLPAENEIKPAPQKMCSRNRKHRHKFEWVSFINFNDTSHFQHKSPTSIQYLAGKKSKDQSHSLSLPSGTKYLGARKTKKKDNLNLCIL